MEEHVVKVTSLEKITHDVIRIVADKPVNYLYTPGQATEIAINKEGWRDERRPFTFTSLPTDDSLEFIIKTYPTHDGVTNQLLHLIKNDELILHDVFGAIAYQGEGVFIAGGAGVTPFIAILRYLQSNKLIGKNMLVFANKSKADIILEKELNDLLGNAFINILSGEKEGDYYQGRISEEFLKSIISNFQQQFYVCGPPPMMDAALKQLTNLGVGDNAITVEI